MKNIVITGGTRGIGAATAKLLAVEGYRILITGRNSEPPEFVEEFDAKVQFARYDAGNIEDLNVLTDWIKCKWNGQVDGLVNNAAMFSSASLETLSMGRFEHLLQVNVVAPAMLSQVLLPFLKLSKGSIINISSIGAQKAWSGSSAYTASKAALNQLTRVWAVELAPTIRVNAIAPGPTDTDILSHSGLEEAQTITLRKREKSMTPLQRIASPENIADGIKFLLSPGASHITGQILQIDGGLGV